MLRAEQDQTFLTILIRIFRLSRRLLILKGAYVMADQSGLVQSHTQIYLHVQITAHMHFCSRKGLLNLNFPNTLLRRNYS